MILWNIIIRPIHDPTQRAEYTISSPLPHMAAKAACRRYAKPLPEGAWVYADCGRTWHAFKRTPNGRILRWAHYLTGG